MSLTWIVEGQVAAMPCPRGSDVGELLDAGVRGVLSLTEHVPEFLLDQPFAHLHVPVRDFSAPTLAQLADAVEFMNDVVRGGGAVAVHCGAGLGRTGTVIAAWLVSHGWRSADAIREVRARRPGSVETSEQEAAIAAFARTLGVE